MQEVITDPKALINYSCTNAKIDLGKSFEAKYGKCIILGSCNFHSLDLKNQNGLNDKEVYLYNSDIGNTGLNLSNVSFVNALESNFEGIDLSKARIGAKEYFDVDPANFSNCNLRNTCCNIILPDRILMNKSLKEKMKQAISSSGKWVGCVVGGKKIHSVQEIEAAKKETMEAYEKMVKDCFGPINETIVKQLAKK